MLQTKNASGPTGIEQWRQKAISVFRITAPEAVSELVSLQERARTPPPEDIDEDNASNYEKKVYELEVKTHFIIED
jgi:hypothetical protein